MSFASPCPKMIIRKALAGDKFAFAQIYNTYKQPVYSLAYRMLQDVDASSDILQQVFLKVMTRLDAINDHTKLGSWIKRITYNCVIDYIRANSRESLGFNDDHFADDFSAPQHNSFDDYDLDVLLRTLNARERSVLILFSVEEYTIRKLPVC